MEKKRTEKAVSGEVIVGDVENKTVCIIDDLISTGTTLSRAVVACKKANANKNFAFVTHGIFVGEVNHALEQAPIHKLIITNTTQRVNSLGNNTKQTILTLDAAPIFAEAIKRLHEGDSLGELMTLDE